MVWQIWRWLRRTLTAVRRHASEDCSRGASGTWARQSGVCVNAPGNRTPRYGAAPPLVGVTLDSCLLA